MIEKNKVTTGLKILTNVVGDALSQAGETLALMSGKDISLDGPGLQLLPAEQFIQLAGGPEVPIVSVYLAISGDIEGHLLLILPYDQAPHLIAMVLGDPDLVKSSSVDSPMDTSFLEEEVSLSVLSELGNVVGTAFLNVVGNKLNMSILPSVPNVVADFAGSILSSLIITSLNEYREELLVVNTKFNEVDKEVYGFFLLLPKPGTFDQFLSKVASLHETN